MRLKELRTKHKKTQQEIADYLGISRGAYTNIENGKREPDFASIKKLAILFSVSVDYLIGFTDDPSFSGGCLAAFIKERRGEESEESFARRCGISVDLLKRIEVGFRKVDEGDRSSEANSLSTEDMIKIAMELSVDWQYIAALYDGYNPRDIKEIHTLPKEDRTDGLSRQILHDARNIARKGLTTQEQLLLSAYQTATPSDREILDNIVGRYTTTSGGQERTGVDIAVELAEMKRQNQELAAKVAAMEEEDAKMEASAELSASALEYDGVSERQRIKK